MLQIIKLRFRVLFHHRLELCHPSVWPRYRSMFFALIKYLPDIFHPVHIDKQKKPPSLSQFIPIKDLSQVSSSRAHQSIKKDPRRTKNPDARIYIYVQLRQTLQRRSNGDRGTIEQAIQRGKSLQNTNTPFSSSGGEFLLGFPKSHQPAYPVALFAFCLIRAVRGCTLLNRKLTLLSIRTSN